MPHHETLGALGAIMKSQSTKKKHVADAERVLQRENQRAANLYLEKMPQLAVPCSNVMCTRCPTHKETYAFCDACNEMLQKLNFYALNLFKTTIAWKRAPKKDRRKIEMAESGKAIRTYVQETLTRTPTSDVK